MVSARRVLCLAAAMAVCAVVPAHGISCPVRSSPMTPGDIEMSHRHFDKAEALYAEESGAAKEPGEADRMHEALIRAELRQSKVDVAEKDAVGWVAAAHATAPKDAWPLVAMADVEWREGKTDEAIRTIQSAQAADICNPEMHAVLANILRMGGLYASASRELTVARQLDPIDRQIETEWVALQPRAVQVAELTKYLAAASSLPEDERKSLTRRKELLSAPPASSCRLVTPVSKASFPFRGIQSGRGQTHWGLAVAFNGKERSLEIDTGASGLVLTKSAARALHLTPEHQFKTGGIGDEGDVDAFVAKVDNIKVGGLEFENCDVQVLGKNPEGMSDIDGLIGGDVFSSFIFTLDFPGRTARLDPLPARPGDESKGPSLDTGVSAGEDVPRDAYHDASMKDWDRIWRSGHDLLMPVRLEQKGPWKLFLLDTGSSMDLISPDAAREVVKVSKGSWLQVAGISGEVKKTWTTGPMALYFSHFDVPSNGLLAIDTSRLGKETGVEVSGLIGAPTLHQLTMSIDYRDNLVHFSYDPKRIRHCMGNVDIPDCY